MTLVDHRGELILLRHNGSPWGRAKLRKVKSCVCCDILLLRGTQVWRPLDNSSQRMERLCLPCGARLARRAGTE